MNGRMLILAGCLLGGAVYLPVISRSEPVPIRSSLTQFPMEIAEWRGVPAPKLADRIVAELGVEEYLNRVYFTPSRMPVGLYIGYYGSQRQGDTIHSPLNCLPGAGWQPLKTGRITIGVDSPGPGRSAERGTRQIDVNRFLIQKGIDQQVVLYWYQSHGRVIASEYWGKIYLVLDAIWMNRTDGALVRVLSPVASGEDGAEAAAERRAVEFVRFLFPLLSGYLPV